MQPLLKFAIILKSNSNQLLILNCLIYFIFSFFILNHVFIHKLSAQEDNKIMIDGKKVDTKEAINSIVKENLEKENIIKIGEYCINQDKLNIKYLRKDSVNADDEKYLIKEKFNLRNWHKSETITEYSIEKVIIAVENASIKSIFVYMEDPELGIFSNQTNPIHNSIFTDSQRNDRLYSSKGDNSFIFLKDVISYYFNDPKYDYLGEQVFILDKKEPCHKIEYDGSMNSIFNLIVYSDFLALLAEQENSLIQFDANVSVPLNQRTIRTNKRILGGIKFFGHLDLDLVVSKFDSQFQEVESTLSNDTLIQVNPLSVFQQSYINGKVYLTFFSWQLNKVIDIGLSLGSVYSLAGVAPIGEGERIDVDVISFVPKFSFKTNPSPVLTIETSFSFYRQQYNFNSQFEEIKPNNILNPEVVLNYSSIENSGSSFFIRFQYFGVLDENESFSQFQFGLKTPVSKMFNKN